MPRLDVRATQGSTLQRQSQIPGCPDWWPLEWIKPYLDGSLALKSCRLPWYHQWVAKRHRWGCAKNGTTNAISSSMLCNDDHRLALDSIFRSMQWVWRITESIYCEKKETKGEEASSFPSACRGWWFLWSSIHDWWLATPEISVRCLSVRWSTPHPLQSSFSLPPPNSMHTVNLEPGFDILHGLCIAVLVSCLGKVLSYRVPIHWYSRGFVHPCWPIVAEFIDASELLTLCKLWIRCVWYEENTLWMRRELIMSSSMTPPLAVSLVGMSWVIISFLSLQSRLRLNESRVYCNLYLSSFDIFLRTPTMFTFSTAELLITPSPLSLLARPGWRVLKQIPRTKYLFGTGCSLCTTLALTISQGWRIWSRMIPFWTLGAGIGHIAIRAAMRCKLIVDRVVTEDCIV